MPEQWRRIDHGDAGTSWINPGPARLNAVFVHGFRGDHLRTWTYRGSWLPRALGKAESVSLFRLLMSDPNLSCNFFSIGHSSGILSPTDLESAGGRIRTFIRNNVLELGLPIALVAHSFGGLACRFAILSMLEEHANDIPIVALLMMGTPNSGTEIARAAAALGSAAGRDMKPFDDSLARLNRDWTAHVVNGGHPDESPASRAPLVCWAAVGTEDRVVPRGSAAALASFSEVEYLNKDHLGLTKARDCADESYQLVSRFLRAAEASVAMRPIEVALQHLTQRFRAASLKGRWVDKEREEIRLEATGDRDIFACRIHNWQEGGLAQRFIRVAVWVTGYRPTALRAEYEWEVGRGVLDDLEFARLVGSGDGLERHFEVANISVRQRGKEGPYRFERCEAGPCWAVLSYRAPEWIQEGEPCDLLSLEFRSSLDRGQGWLYYSVARTVIGHLDVVFSAPFRYGIISRLGLGQDVEQPERVGEYFMSRAQCAGPIALGRNIIWVYGAEPESRAPDRHGGAHERTG